jgi:hypothetical protein
MIHGLSRVDELDEVNRRRAALALKLRMPATAASTAA